MASSWSPPPATAAPTPTALDYPAFDPYVVAVGAADTGGTCDPRRRRRRHLLKRGSAPAGPTSSRPASASSACASPAPSSTRRSPALASASGFPRLRHLPGRRGGLRRRRAPDPGDVPASILTRSRRCSAPGARPSARRRQRPPGRRCARRGRLGGPRPCRASADQKFPLARLGGWLRGAPSPIAVRDREPEGLALDRFALDRLALDRQPLDGLALDGLALDRLPLDRLALDRLALDDTHRAGDGAAMERLGAMSRAGLAASGRSTSPSSSQPSRSTSSTSASPAPGTAAHLPWWALAVAFALTEVAVVHVHFRRSSHSLTLGELPLALGLLFAAPGDLVIGWVVGAARRARPSTATCRALRLVFNLAPDRRSTAGIAAAVFHALCGRRRPGPQAWSARAVRRPVAAAVSVVLVGAAMWLSGDGMAPRKLGAMVGWRSPWRRPTRASALPRGTCRGTDPRGMILLLAPALAVFLAYRAYTRRSARAPTSSSSTRRAARSRRGRHRAGVAGMLAMALETFRGERAEVCLARRRAATTRRASHVGAAEHPRDHAAAAPTVSEGLLRGSSAADPAARIVTAGASAGALAAHLRRLGARDGDARRRCRARAACSARC